MTTFNLVRTRPWYALLMALVIGGMAVLLAACGGAEADLPPPQGPVIVQQPVDQSIPAGGSTTFTVSVSSSGATFQWQQLVGGVWTDLSGANGASLPISGATDTQNGTQYRAVTAVGGTTLISSPATLTVTPAPVAPTIAVQPADQTVTEPDSATFNVTASGTATLAYQWQRNVAGTWSNITGATGPSYTLPAAVRAADDAAQFRVVVTNSVGAQTSSIATLTVNPAPVAPAFTTQPADATVVEPASASFTVAATGTPAPALQWQASTDGGANWANVATGSGATSTTHTTAATGTVMSGYRYRALASSSAGTAISNTATLTVNAAAAAPAITQQPANASVPSSTTATFSVAASGSPSPTYQWQRQAPGGGGFANITGATGPSYSTPAVAFLDDGDVTDTGAQYRAVATNSQGSVTSNAATLTVTPVALTGFAQISAGQRHVLALHNDGTVWAWGNNGSGEVGRTCSACVPKPVAGLSGTFTQVLARENTSFALRSDGTVWAWGFNGNGQLGRNLAASGGANPTPAAVLRASDGLALAGIVGLTMTQGGGSGGAASVLAWTAAGVAWKWGSAFIEPGLGGVPSNNFIAAVPHVYFDGSSAARSVARAVAGKDGLVIAIDGTGAAVFWTGRFDGSSFGTEPVIPFTARGFSGTAIDIAVDGDRVAIVRSDNTLWGQAYQLGAFGGVSWDDLRFPLVQISVPGPVTGAAVGRSGQVTYALGASGALYAAGFDVDGQLADGTAGGSRATFAPVLTIDDASKAAIGLESGLALRPGGAIWGWGNNFYRANGTSDSAGRPATAPGWTRVEASPFAVSGR